MIRSLLVLFAAIAPVSFSNAPATALPLISEVFYDATGSDDGQGFIELVGAPGSSLDGLVLEAVNGTGGAVYASLDLTGTVAADGVFVVADRDGSGTTAVAGADLLRDFDLQNGPDSLVLRGPAGVLDALAYGAFGAGQVAVGEGAPAPDAPAGQSLARPFADLDTDDNARDFAVGAPTPGVAVRQVAVVEPVGGVLAAAGVALGAALRASRRATARVWPRR